MAEAVTAHVLDYPSFADRLLHGLLEVNLVNMMAGTQGFTQAIKELRLLGRRRGNSRVSTEWI
jgi:hypothetical protein